MAILTNPPLLCNGECDGIKAPVEGAPANKKTHADSFGDGGGAGGLGSAAVGPQAGATGVVIIRYIKS